MKSDTGLHFLSIFMVIALTIGGVLGCTGGDGGENRSEEILCEIDADCVDGNICTEDSCSANTGNCVNTPMPGENCGAGDICNGIPTCDAAGVCVTTPVDCDDGNLCTEDSCDPDTGTCGNGPVVCGQNDNVCTVAVCSLATGECIEDPQSGNACLKTCFEPGVCADGTCELGPPVDCGDGDQCTFDSCDPDSGACVNTISWGTICDISDPGNCNPQGECNQEGMCVQRGYCYDISGDIIVSAPTNFDDDIWFATTADMIVANVPISTVAGANIYVNIGGSFNMPTVVAALDCAGSIDINAGGDALIAGPISSAGDIVFHVGSDVTLASTSSFTSVQGRIDIKVNNDFTMPGKIFSEGNLTLIAGGDVTMEYTTAFRSSNGGISIEAGNNFTKPITVPLAAFGIIRIDIGGTATIQGQANLDAERIEVYGNSADNGFNLQPDDTTPIDVFGGSGSDTLNYEGSGCVTLSTATSGVIHSATGFADMTFQDIGVVNLTSVDCP